MATRRTTVKEYGERTPAGIDLSAFEMPEGMVVSSITLSPAADGTVHIEGLAANIEQTAGDIAAPYQGDSTTCPVRIWRGGDYLLVADNPHCGAPDVTFIGFYTKQ